MTAAVRENDRKLKGGFGEASWKVALEPERRTAMRRKKYFGINAVSVHD